MARLVRWQILLAALGILIVGGLLAQLSFTHPTIIVPIQGGTYVEGLVGTAQDLNPLLSTTDTDRAISSLLFQGLTALQPDGSVAPALAESWEISPNGTVYTFTLRSDAKWHDGNPLTAQDVRFTIDLLRSPDFADPNHLAGLWHNVQVDVLDDLRIRFTLESPYTPFLSYTTLPILPRHKLQDVAPADLSLSPFNREPVGTGPFSVGGFEEAEDGTLVLNLEANLDPGMQLQPFLEKLQFRFYRDEGLLTEALLRGEVDGAFGLSKEALEQLAERATGDLNVYKTYLQAHTILFLNTDSLLLSDLRMRQAIALALDLQALVELLDREAFVANGPISPISWAYKPDLPPYQQDLERATSLLEESGWHDLDGDGTREIDVRPLELTLITRDIPEERVTLARWIKQQLAPLGMAVRVIVLEDPQAFREHVETRDFDLLLDGVSQLGRDPDEFALWHSSQVGPDGSNYSSFQNEEADWLLEQGRTIVDQDQRTDLYWRFQELFVREIPAIPLYYPVYAYVMQPRILGVRLTPLNDLGDRFRYASGWYIKTQKMIMGRSRPAERYEGDQPRPAE